MYPPLHDAAQRFQSLGIRLKNRMLVELKILQLFQVLPNFLAHEPFGRQEQVCAEFRLAMGDVPIRRAKLVVVQLRERGAVVVVDWRHPQERHAWGIKEGAEVSVVAVGVQDNGVQDAHAPEGILPADFSEEIQHLSCGFLLALEQHSGLDEPNVLAGEQTALADKPSVIKRQVIADAGWADFRGELSGEVLG